MVTVNSFLPVGFADLILNAVFRGVIGTPPATLYFVVGEGVHPGVAAPLTGMTRIPFVPGQYRFGSTDNWYSESSGTGTVASGLYAGIPTDTPMFVHLPTSIEGLTTPMYLMIYDAATGGNLMLVQKIADCGPAFIGGILLDLSGGGVYASYIDTTGSALLAAIVNDWLFRGYDSMNVRMPVATYANTYLWLMDFYDSTITRMPKTAIPRSAASWSAPADIGDGSGVRYIQNLNTITVGPANVASTTVQPMRLRLSNIVQSVPDMLAAPHGETYRVLQIGDNISFAPGELQIALFS